MAYRERPPYDDMGTYSSRRPTKSSSRTLIVGIVAFALVLCVIIIVVWILLFSTPKEAKKAPELTIETPSTPLTTGESPLLTSSVLPSVPPALTVETPRPSQVGVRSTSENAILFREHIVSEGESLDSIAELYNLTKETLISVNRIRSVTSIKVGDRWQIPDRDGQLYTVQSGDSLSIITSRYNPTLGWKTLQELNSLSNDVIHPGQELFIPSTRIEDDGSFASYDRFIRPAEGRLAALYGQTVKYRHAEEPSQLKGIWIEGSLGSPVIASATGRVVDIGNQSELLGRFITLSHSHGYQTTYGHLDSIEVNIGDQVGQGDKIATVGQSGDIERTLLYFSLEQEGIALNPINFF